MIAKHFSRLPILIKSATVIYFGEQCRPTNNKDEIIHNFTWI